MSGFAADGFTVGISLLAGFDERSKEDPNTKRFKRTLIYFEIDTQYANFRGNPLC